MPWPAVRRAGPDLSLIWNVFLSGVPFSPCRRRAGHVPRCSGETEWWNSYPEGGPHADHAIPWERCRTCRERISRTASGPKNRIHEQVPSTLAGVHTPDQTRPEPHDRHLPASRPFALARRTGPDGSDSHGDRAPGGRTLRAGPRLRGRRTARSLTADTLFHLTGAGPCDQDALLEYSA